MSEAGSAQRSITRLVGSIALKLLRIGACTCLLWSLEALSYCAPYVPTVLRKLALLGTVLSLVFELVVRVPEFPFWRAMALPIICAALLLLHSALREQGT